MEQLVGNPYFHLETRKKQLERQRAELLAQAKAARELAAPIEGQMVSGHYVPNHWSAYLQQPAAGLANAVSQGMADRDERVAAEEEASAASAHMANMPSARTREVPAPPVAPQRRALLLVRASSRRARRSGACRSRPRSRQDGAGAWGPEVCAGSGVGVGRTPPHADAREASCRP